MGFLASDKETFIEKIKQQGYHGKAIGTDYDPIGPTDVEEDEKRRITNH